MHRALLVALCAGCAAGQPESGTLGPTSTPQPAVEQPDEPFRVVSPRERVPAFRLTTTDGELIDSNALEGKAFVVVFFASWCSVCEVKLPEVERALAEAGGGVASFAVSVDDSASWADVAAFRERLGLGMRLVRGQQYERFARAWDPFQSVPVVAVVGRNGYLVDYQIGYAEGHFQRLVEAVKVARELPIDLEPIR